MKTIEEIKEEWREYLKRTTCLRDNLIINVNYLYQIIEEQQNIINELEQHKRYIDNEPYTHEEMVEMQGKWVWDNIKKMYCTIPYVNELVIFNPILNAYQPYEPKRYYPREVLND